MSPTIACPTGRTPPTTAAPAKSVKDAWRRAIARARSPPSSDWPQTLDRASYIGIGMLMAMAWYRDIGDAWGGRGGGGGVASVSPSL